MGHRKFGTTKAIKASHTEKPNRKLVPTSKSISKKKIEDRLQFSSKRKVRSESCLCNIFNEQLELVTFNISYSLFRLMNGLGTKSRKSTLLFKSYLRTLKYSVTSKQI